MWISEEEEARSTAAAVHLGSGHHLQQQSSLQLRGICPERAAGAGVHSRGLHGGDWSVGIIPTQASFLPSHSVLLHTLRELKLCLSLFGESHVRIIFQVHFNNACRIALILHFYLQITQQ